MQRFFFFIFLLNFMFLQDGNNSPGRAEFGESFLGNHRRVTVDDTSLAEELLATDGAVEVLDEVDKRAFLQEKASAAIRSSARKSCQDEYRKETKCQHPASLKNTEQNTQRGGKNRVFFVLSSRLTSTFRR